MFALRQPSDSEIHGFLVSQKDSRFSYDTVGLTRTGGAPDGFNVDHNRICLGTGLQAFVKAVDAIRQWKMFAMPQTQLCWPDTSIEEGSTVAIVFCHFGFWSINAARIVYVLEERGGIERFAFAYGTLLDHAESGEERFAVEWNRADDSVYYDLFAFSRPRHPLVRMAKPLARRLQRSFIEASKMAMFDHVNR